MEPPHYVLGGLLSPVGPQEYRELKVKEWERIYENARSRVPESVPMEPLLLHGEPAEVLAEGASDLDLLLLGSRGYGPVKGTMLGSVSARVMAAAPCPVIVIPRGAGSRPLEPIGPISPQIVSGTISIAPQGHSATQRPQPLQKSRSIS